VRNRLALRRHALDREVLQNDIQLAVSCHIISKQSYKYKHYFVTPDLS
jgi:hypothetical protein